MRGISSTNLENKEVSVQAKLKNLKKYEFHFLQALKTSKNMNFIFLYFRLTGYKYPDGRSAPCSALCDPSYGTGLLCAQSCGLCSQVDEGYKFVNEKKEIEYTSCDDTQTQTMNVTFAL